MDDWDQAPMLSHVWTAQGFFLLLATATCISIGIVLFFKDTKTVQTLLPLVSSSLELEAMSSEDVTLDILHCAEEYPKGGPKTGRRGLTCRQLDYYGRPDGAVGILVPHYVHKGATSLASYVRGAASGVSGRHWGKSECMVRYAILAHLASLYKPMDTNFLSHTAKPKGRERTQKGLRELQVLIDKKKNDKRDKIASRNEPIMKEAHGVTDFKILWDRIVNRKHSFSKERHVHTKEHGCFDSRPVYGVDGLGERESDLVKDVVYGLEQIADAAHGPTASRHKFTDAFAIPFHYAEDYVRFVATLSLFVSRAPLLAVDVFHMHSHELVDKAARVLGTAVRELMEHGASWRWRPARSAASRAIARHVLGPGKSQLVWPGPPVTHAVIMQLVRDELKVSNLDHAFTVETTLMNTLFEKNKVEMPEITYFTFCNPGGRGHEWHMRRPKEGIKRLDVGTGEKEFLELLGKADFYGLVSGVGTHSGTFAKKVASKYLDMPKFPPRVALMVTKAISTERWIPPSFPKQSIRKTTHLPRELSEELRWIMHRIMDAMIPSTR